MGLPTASYETALVGGTVTNAILVFSTILNTSYPPDGNAPQLRFLNGTTTLPTGPTTPSPTATFSVGNMFDTPLALFCQAGDATLGNLKVDIISPNRSQTLSPFGRAAPSLVGNWESGSDVISLDYAVGYLGTDYLTEDDS